MAGEHEVCQFKSVVVAGPCAACGEDLTSTVHADGDKLYHPSCCPCQAEHLPDVEPVPTEGEQTGMFEPEREYPD